MLPCKITLQGLEIHDRDTCKVSQRRKLHCPVWAGIEKHFLWFMCGEQGESFLSTLLLGSWPTAQPSPSHPIMFGTVFQAQHYPRRSWCYQGNTTPWHPLFYFILFWRTGWRAQGLLCWTISKSSRGMLANKHPDLRLSGGKSALIVSGIQLFTKAFKEQTNKRRQRRRDRRGADLSLPSHCFPSPL